MAKIKKKSEAELRKEELRRQWSFIEEEIFFIPEPTYLFEIGEHVGCGSLKNCVIEDVLLGGKVYLVNYTAVNNNFGNPVETPNSLKYITWISIFSKKESEETEFSTKDNLELSFKQMTISSLFSKVYSFGVNFEPEYQRGYVWSMEDKIDLIDSIFEHVEIGKFAFVECDNEKYMKTKLSYEILDGKQRLSTLCEFYEGRLSYRGKLFKDLSEKDRRHILSYPVSIAEVRNATDEQILSYFIKLNSHGRVMEKEHLDNVRKMLSEK